MMKKLLGICFTTVLWLSPSAVLMAAPPEGIVDCSCPDGETITCLVSAGCYPNTSSNFYPGGAFSCDEVCAGEGHGAPADPEPDPTPDPEPEPVAEPCSALPVLENFTATESACETERVYIKFTPQNDPGFYLHIQVEMQEQKDVLSAWCTGNAQLCKAVGNGQVCSGTDYSGANAWCYKE